MAAVPADAAGAPAGAVTSLQAPNEVPLQVSDPLQPLNRAMFRVDRAVNRVAAGRLHVIGVAGWAPVPLRRGVFNALANLGEPATAANDVLQRKGGRAAKAALRFVINSTIGLAGLVDVAARMGVHRAEEDFGQTLAVYGVKPGPYIFLPLAGPTTVRDALGTVVDSLISPTRWLGMSEMQRRSVSVVKNQIVPPTVAIRQIARTDAAGRRTPDEYAELRRLYFRQRARQIADRPNLVDDPDLLKKARNAARGRSRSYQASE